MTDIDWSKAPEGATRYHPETIKTIEHWLKIVGGEEWIWTSSGKRWMPHLDVVVDGEYHDRPAPEWSGEGLPPVGTVCMTIHNDKELEVKILAYAGGADGRDYVMVCEMLGDLEDQLHAWVAQMCTFSPIKTPEQIAAEEREKAIEAMVEVMRAARFCQTTTNLSPSDMAWAYAEALMQTGYRKVEGGAE